MEDKASSSTLLFTTLQLGKRTKAKGTRISSSACSLSQKAHRLMLSLISKDFILRLIDYTPAYHYKSKEGKRLGNNTIVAVYSVLRSVIGKAYRDGILPSNPTEEFRVSDYVKGTETERAYLELEELRRFATVETRHLLEKQAFVFSCICGLRVSDVRKLTWGDIKKVGDNYKIEIRQKKTRDRLSNPLSPEILHWLPERSDEALSSDIVFPLVAEQYVNDKIREIAKEAGIHKHLSFHSARHTCATMMLTLGVDLYTVSKLLGHRRVTTTQIYGNIVGFAFLSHDSGKSE